MGNSGHPPYAASEKTFFTVPEKLAKRPRALREPQKFKADDLANPDSASSRDPEMNALTDHLFLPEKEELDKLLRYEAMINRQLNHAMGELERVQTRRKGEATPTNI